jgi:hypothetical protein
VPHALVRRFGGSLIDVRPPANTPALRATLRAVTGGIWSDPGAYMLPAFGATGADYVLVGHHAEVARCFYGKSGSGARVHDAASLAAAARFAPHPRVLAAFDTWQRALPACGLDPLDLLYWEHRAGNWAALLLTAADAFCRPIPPFNNRRLLSVALSAPSQTRCQPYRLQRRVCEILLPGSTELPFNYSRRDAFKSRVLGMLPWRLQRRLDRAAAAEAVTLWD